MLLILGGEMQAARGQRPNLHDSRRRVGSHYPLARPHAIPGVRGSNGEHGEPDGTLHLTAVTTTGQRAWSGEDADVQRE